MGSQLSINFSSSCKKKKKKRKRSTEDQSVAQCCITNLLPVSIVKHCRQAELTEVSFEGFSFMVPPQPSAAAYRGLVRDAFSHLRK